MKKKIVFTEAAHKGLKGPAIIPFHVISGKQAEDGDRIRCDSAKTVNFHTPKVTILGKGFYQGPEGYYDSVNAFKSKLGYSV